MRTHFSNSHGLVGIQLYRKSPFLGPNVSLSLSLSLIPLPTSLSQYLAHVRSCLLQQRPKPHLLLSLSPSLHPVSGGVESWLCLIAEWQDLRGKIGSRCVCQRFTSPNPGRERRGRCRKEVFGVWEWVSWGIFTQWGGEERGETLK